MVQYYQHALNSVVWLLMFPTVRESKLQAFSIALGVRPDQTILIDITSKSEHICHN